jgi:hypothetical protein
MYDWILKIQSTMFFPSNVGGLMDLISAASSFG